MGRGRGNGAGQRKGPAAPRGGQGALSFMDEVELALDSNRAAVRDQFLAAFSAIDDPGGDLHELFEALERNSSTADIEALWAIVRGGADSQVPPREFPIDQMVRRMTIFNEGLGDHPEGVRRRKLLDECHRTASLEPIRGDATKYGVSGLVRDRFMGGALRPLIHRQVMSLLDAEDFEGVRQRMGELWEIWGDPKRAQAHRSMSDENLQATRRWMAAAELLWGIRDGEEPPAFDLFTDMPLMDQDALDLLAVRRLGGERRLRAIYRHGNRALSIGFATIAENADEFERQLVDVLRTPQAWQLRESGPGGVCISVPASDDGFKDVVERFAGTPLEGRVRLIEMTSPVGQGPSRRQFALAYGIEANHHGEAITVQAVLPLGGESSAATPEGVRRFIAPALQRHGYIDPIAQRELIERMEAIEGPLRPREKGSLGPINPARVLPDLGVEDRCPHTRVIRTRTGSDHDYRTDCPACHRRFMVMTPGHRFPTGTPEGDLWRAAVSSKPEFLTHYVKEETAYSIALGLETPPPGVSDEEAIGFYQRRDGWASARPIEDLPGSERRRSSVPSVAAAMNRR